MVGSVSPPGWANKNRVSWGPAVVSDMFSRIYSMLGGESPSSRNSSCRLFEQASNHDSGAQLFPPRATARNAGWISRRAATAEGARCHLSCPRLYHWSGSWRQGYNQTRLTEFFGKSGSKHVHCSANKTPILECCHPPDRCITPTGPPRLWAPGWHRCAYHDRMTARIACRYRWNNVGLRSILHCVDMKIVCFLFSAVNSNEQFLPQPNPFGSLGLRVP